MVLGIPACGHQALAKSLASKGTEPQGTFGWFVSFSIIPKAQLKSEAVNVFLDGFRWDSVNEGHLPKQGLNRNVELPSDFKKGIEA